MINAKCSLNSLNKIVVTISMVVLTIVMIFSMLYYIYIKRNNIFENYTEVISNQVDVTQPIYPQDNQTQDEESKCTFPKIKYPENVTFRDCTVYFTSNITECDNAKSTNPNNTCKYTFHGWKEFDTAEDNGKTINYPNKVYSCNYNIDIVNSPLTNKCFMPFISNTTPKRYEYPSNELINHDCKGTSGNIENDTNKFNNNYYTSFNFLNNANPSTNFNNVIDSICSVKYNPFNELKYKKFYKFSLDEFFNIQNVEKYTFNAKQTELIKDNTFSIRNFTSSTAYGLDYKNTNIFNIFKNTKYPNKNVNIYTFNYNYLCNAQQVMSYNKYNQIINIGPIIHSTNVTERTTSLSINNLLNWDNYKKQFDARGNRIDHRPKIISDLKNKRNDIYNEIDTHYNGRIKPLNIEKTTIQTNLNNANNEKNNYNPTFDDIAQLFNISNNVKVQTRHYDIIPINRSNTNNLFTNNIVEFSDKTVVPTIVNGKLIFTFNKDTIMIIKNSINCLVTLKGGGGSGSASTNWKGGDGYDGQIIKKNIKFNNGTYNLDIGNGGHPVSIYRNNCRCPKGATLYDNNKKCKSTKTTQERKFHSTYPANCRTEKYTYTGKRTICDVCNSGDEPRKDLKGTITCYHFNTVNMQSENIYSSTCTYGTRNGNKGESTSIKYNNGTFYSANGGNGGNSRNSYNNIQNTGRGIKANYDTSLLSGRGANGHIILSFDIKEIHQIISLLYDKNNEYSSGDNNSYITQNSRQSNALDFTVHNNKVSIYKLYANMFLQKGYYQLYAYVQTSTNIPQISQFSIYDDTTQKYKIIYTVTSKLNKNNTVTYTRTKTKKFIYIPNGGFYKVFFKCACENNTTSNITASLKLFANYQVRAAPATAQTISQYSERSNEVLIDNNIPTRSILNYNNNMKDNKSYYDMNLTHLLYDQNINLDDDAKRVFYPINIFTANQSNNLHILKNYLNDKRDHWRINEYTANLNKVIIDINNLNICRDIEKNLIDISKHPRLTINSPQRRNDVINIDNMISVFTNINYRNIMGAQNTPTLNNTNVFNIFTNQLSDIQKTQLLTIERFNRDKLTSDGNLPLPSIANRSLYIEVFT